MLRADHYFMDHDRLPWLGDGGPPPWRYWGWLCMITKFMHIDPAEGLIENRWGYLIETRKRGRLLDEPIPHLFFSAPDDKGMKHLEKLIHVMEGPYRAWESFSMLVDWLAWGCGATEHYPERITDEMAEQLYRLLNVRLWLERPSDYLGHCIEVFTGPGANPTGFYPTPFDVIKLLLRLQIDPDAGDLRDKTFCDPAVGTGRTLLAASNYSMRLYGQDIDGFVLKICLINGCFYAPWMIHPLPEEFWQKHERERSFHDMARTLIAFDRNHVRPRQTPPVLDVPAAESPQLVMPIGGVVPARAHRLSAPRRSTPADTAIQEELF